MLQNMSLTLLADNLAICQFDVLQGIPDWAKVNNPFSSVTFTEDEISAVIPQDAVPAKFERCEKGWRIMKIDGILDFNLHGVLLFILKILERCSISVFVLSTFNTDYILIKEKDRERAVKALRKSLTVNNM